MTRLSWSDPSSRQFEAGLDRGVLYLRDQSIDILSTVLNDSFLGVGYKAVAWNGLTGVDEGGGDSATSYYIDGRPFLYFPKPKEFAASLKAYTYPDEFDEVMGRIEAAPGMYLDSQQPDAFGLSYRTMVGNAAVGENAGYKIHLIYNATVVPDSLSYETLSNTVNPIEFSWSIQAVPVPIEGYRATAHIIIDTRKMDADVLANLEVMLYGDDTRPGTLPDPQLIFDMLAYGDAIIITDLEDGTWSAEGSASNIYLIDDGIFQIDNVNAVDHGDGTYTVSTTL